MGECDIELVEVPIAILSIPYLELCPFLVFKICDFRACSTSYMALRGFPKVADPLAIAEAQLIMLSLPRG